MEGNSAEDCGVSTDDQPEPGSRQGYIHSPGICQEPDPQPFIRSHSRYHDVVLFPALEAINRCHLYPLVNFLRKGSVLAEVVKDVGALALVRRDDSELLGFDAAFDHPVDDALKSNGLTPVQVASSGGRDFLGTTNVVEEHRLGFARPREVAFIHPLCNRHTDLKRSLVERVRGEYR